MLRLLTLELGLKRCGDYCGVASINWEDNLVFMIGQLATKGKILRFKNILFLEVIVFFFTDPIRNKFHIFLTRNIIISQLRFY